MYICETCNAIIDHPIPKKGFSVCPMGHRAQSDSIWKGLFIGLVATALMAGGITTMFGPESKTVVGSLIGGIVLIFVFLGVRKLNSTHPTSRLSRFFLAWAFGGLVTMAVYRFLGSSS